MSQGFRNTTGWCIYCGSTDGPLTKEHIIPAGLNGDITIAEASCGDCAKLTSQFEREVMRDCLQAPRAALGLRSRRKKDVPAAFPVQVTSPVGVMQSAARADEYPAIIPLPVLGRSAPEQEQVELLDFVWINLDDASERALSLAAPTIAPEEVGTGAERRVEVQVPFKAHSFARMIAKIGYCFAVATHGAAAFDDPALIDFVLGRTERTGTYLRSSTEALPPETSLHTYDTEEHDGFVRVRFRLFASFGSPCYEVIVARATGS